MIVFAIDPGPELSAFVRYESDHARVIAFGKVANAELLRLVKVEAVGLARVLAVEMVASYGMPVGREVFETCVWIGRFVQAWPDSAEHVLLYRSTIKAHLCHTAKAKDANVRQSLIDRFGGSRQKAIGTKRSPGPLYGVSNDVWSALAIAVTLSDTHKERAL